MPMYRMATVTLWQADPPDQIRGHAHVFLRFGPGEHSTLVRLELRSQVPVDKSPREWLLTALAEWLETLA